MNQREAVVRYMKKHGSITPAQAYTELGVERLAARISEIKLEHGVKTEYIMVRNRLGQKIRVARYSLEEEA